MTMNNLLRDDEPPGEWSQLGPVIEDAMHELDAKDRDATPAIFSEESLDEVGAGLNLTENAAPDARRAALEKLRDKLSRRGMSPPRRRFRHRFRQRVWVPAVFHRQFQGSLAAAHPRINHHRHSQNTPYDHIAKSIVTAACHGGGNRDLCCSPGFTTARPNPGARTQTGATGRTSPTIEQERTQATRQLAALTTENDRLKSGQNSKELLKLRGQVGMLREQAAASEAKANAPASGLAKMMNDPAMRDYLRQAQMDSKVALHGLL